LFNRIWGKGPKVFGRTIDSNMGDGSGGGGGEEPPPELLGEGDYFAAGEITLEPYVGNYTQTTKFADGSAGDTTTRETSSQAGITIIKVLAAPISIATWDLTMKYKGTFTTSLADQYAYWDGSQWVAITDQNAGSWTGHFLSYSDESRQAQFAAVPAASIFAMRFTESNTDDGFASCSDSRVSA
jgi:hypothetical protein